MAEITTLEDLLALYGEPPIGALTKHQHSIHPTFRALIEASPFCVMATVGPDGLDCGPRGDEYGFVRVIDEHTVEIPDRKGNNRLDNLRNIIVDPRVALLFLIPQRNETMRVMGEAVITTDADTLAAHAIDGKAPATVIRVTVTDAYHHCGKAMIRSGLWKPDTWAATDELPSTGTIAASFRDGVDVDEYDATLEQNLIDDLF